MTRPPTRRPGAFPIGEEGSASSGAAGQAPQAPKKTADAAPRRPRAMSADVTILADSEDYFESAQELERLEPPPAVPRRRRFGLGKVLAGALGLLVSLAVGLWVDALVRELFQRADWLGWLAFGLAFLAATAFLAIVVREIAGMMQLASIARLRQEAAGAKDGSLEEARHLVRRAAALSAARAETAHGRKILDSLEGEVVDPGDLMAIAERELLRPLDRKARRLILDAAKRVSMVTAVSPRALVDVGYVVFESMRLIRRMAELYGGRPGMLGFLRLTRDVVGHLAVTGSIAVGDSIIQQLIGHGLAARLSAKLGEGVINGLLTARIGISAMDLCRPLPFAAERRPGIGDFLGDLTRLAARQGEQAETPRR